MFLRTNRDEEKNLSLSKGTFRRMDIAAIENDRNPSKHDWIKIFYMITALIGLIIEISQRISVNIFYASCSSKSICRKSNSNLLSLDRHLQVLSRSIDQSISNGIYRIKYEH